LRISDGKPLKSRRSKRKAASPKSTIETGRGTRALVLCPVLARANQSAANGGASSGSNDFSSARTQQSEARLTEAIGLARAIDLDVRGEGFVPVARPRPATLFGSGKVEELSGLVRAEDAGLVIVDHQLSPVQQRNLERAWGAKVLDRTGLILEIFGRRARTKEGRLQVELAHLTYQKSRLVRSWTHLERQRGGFGFLGGPGETQIEADRRVIQDRIGAIHKDLERVKRTRGLHRQSRERVPYPVVALVGYTNAGKSTLFNRLTGAGVSAQDLLFATLDPTMREVSLPGTGRIILSDTVGFISELPTTLIAAFRATLEEVVEADLLLHVRDMSDPNCETQRADVEHVLSALGIDAGDDQSPLLEVWNKIDLLDGPEREHAMNSASRSGGDAVCISAATGEGVDELLLAIQERIDANHEMVDFELDAKNGALINWIHENSEVLTRQASGPTGYRYSVRISAEKKNKLMRRLEAQAG